MGSDAPGIGGFAAGPDADERTRQQITRKVVFHEDSINTCYMVGEKPAALWFNEGCAQFFEDAETRTGRHAVTLSPEELKKLAGLFKDGKFHDLRSFIALDHIGFYADGARERNYMLAHALLYYLLKGAPAEGNRLYAAIPLRYCRDLQKNTPEVALNRTFDGVDLSALSKELSDFWNNRRRLDKAERYRPVGRAVSK